MTATIEVVCLLFLLLNVAKRKNRRSYVTTKQDRLQYVAVARDLEWTRQADR